EKPKNMKHSKYYLFLTYWCRINSDKSKNINKMLTDFEKFINKSLTVNSLARMNYELSIIKQLIFNADELALIRKVYNKLFNGDNSFINSLKNQLIGTEKEKFLFENENISHSVKLKKLAE